MNSTLKYQDSCEAKPLAGRILLVDDERDFLRVTRRLLERFGYQVTSFQNAVEALLHFQQNVHSYDVVITDQTMPNLDGVDLFIRLRSCNSTIPVVVCSGNCHTIPLSMVCNLGLDAILQKPVDILSLDQLLQQLIHRKSETFSHKGEDSPS